MHPFINIHSHQIEKESTIISIYNQKLYDIKVDSHYYSIGIHPWWINSLTIATDLKQVVTLINSPNCLAIGECGLDKIIETDFELQQALFIKQIQIAKHTNKPLLIHCVKAFDELIALKKQFPKVVMIIHGFSKNAILGKQLQKHGFYLSYGTHLFNNDNLLQGINPKMLFLETDEDDVTIQSVYANASKQLNVSLPALKKEIAANFKNIFKI